MPVLEGLPEKESQEAETQIADLAVSAKQAAPPSADDAAPKTPRKKTSIFDAIQTPEAPKSAALPAAASRPGPVTALAVQAKAPQPKAKAPIVPRKVTVKEAQQDTADIPDLQDTQAPKPELGQHTLSPQAIRMRTQRLFKRRANGGLKVSEHVFKEWHERGARRNMLETIFQQCGYCPVPGRDSRAG